MEDLEQAVEYIRKRVEDNGGEVAEASALHMGRGSMRVSLQLVGEDTERQAIVTHEQLAADNA